MSIDVRHGDSREVLKSLADASIDSCVTDPPYGFLFMGAYWDRAHDQPAFDPEFWAEVLRVLKPGAHLLAFSGTRTYHRMVCAIEGAGFEIRDQIGWAYGSGFPKSHSLTGKVDGYEGFGTALKPAWEPIVVARKPFKGTIAANVMQHGTGAINVDGCRVAYESDSDKAAALSGDAFKRKDTSDKGWSRPWMEDSEKVAAMNAASKERAQAGRWPANLVHDGSPEVLACFPDTQSGTGAIKRDSAAGTQGNTYGKESRPAGTVMSCIGDAGSSARFFYTAKADASDRLGSKHPTVKPVDLMRWLCRLVTPPGGLVLDPFAGSGTTGMACMAEGFDAVLIEREAQFVEDIKRRIAHVSGEDAPLFAGEVA